MSSEKIPQINDINMSLVHDDKGHLYYSDDIIIIGDMKVFARNLERAIYQGNLKLDFNVVVFCMKGSIQMTVNGVTERVDENSIMLIPVRTLVCDVMVSPDAECIVLYITNRIMNQLLGPDINIWNKVVFRDQIKTMKVEEYSLAMIRSYYNLATIKVSNQKNIYLDKMVFALVQIALYEMLYMFQQKHPAILGSYDVNAPSGSHLFNRFLDMLTHTSPKYHPVNYYADQLSITPKYLSVICKQSSGKTALEWIEEAVLEEIRFYLSQQNLAIKDVARMTGFDNPSFFGQYVKQHFGCTPLTYREKNK